MSTTPVLTTGLTIIDKSVIIDKDNTVVLCGSALRKRFANSFTLHPVQSIFDLFSELDCFDALVDTIAATRQTKESITLTIKKTGETFYFFGQSEKNDDMLIISMGEAVQSVLNIEFELKERVKELECLYNVNNAIDDADNLEQACSRSVPLLIRAFQFPELASAYIVVDSVTYGDQINYNEQINQVVREDITVFGRFRGEVVVFYTKKTPFLIEEQRLVKEIAFIFSKTLERVEARTDLEKQKAILQQKNRELLELSEQYSLSSKKLEILFNALTDTIVVIDRNFSITLSNKIEPGTNRYCFKEVFGLDQICTDCPGQKTFKHAVSFSLERKEKNKWFSLNTYPILGSDGTVDRIIEICRDITKQKEIEHQLFQSYKLASMGKLVSGVAHEINNPNTFIRGNIKIIQEAFKDILPYLDAIAAEKNDFKIARLSYPVFKENITVLIDDMLRGANRIKKIVDGLLSYAKKDEGLLTDTVSIPEVIENSLRLIDSHIRKNAKVITNFQQDLPTIKGNIQKLEQVMINLLINASQAMDKPEGTITIEVRYDKTNREVITRISDNGKGINDKDLKYIFDPFFTTKRNCGGTGLGLSISYGIIKEHEGRIETISQLGKGTTFTLYLPLNPLSDKLVNKK